MEIKKTYYIEGVEFEKMEDFMKICKCDLEEFPISLIKKGFDKPGSKYATKISEAEKLYNKVEKMTVAEALKFPNMEQRMVALKFVGPDKIVSELKGKLISQETLTKKHNRWFPKKHIKVSGVKPVGYKEIVEDMFDQKMVEFEDTYSLYRINKKKLETDEDVFILHCKCPSTGRNYYLFIEPQHATKTAIDAVASTMRDKDNKVLTKTEYLDMEIES